MTDYTHCWVTLCLGRHELMSTPKAENWWQTKESPAKSIWINQRILFCSLPGVWVWEQGWLNCSHIIKSPPQHGDSSWSWHLGVHCRTCRPVSSVSYSVCLIHTSPRHLAWFPLLTHLYHLHSLWEGRGLTQLVSFRDFLGPLNQFFPVS
jgi:hypothetical protein